MRYKLLGKSGLRVSELCLGAMTFGKDWGFGEDKEKCRQVFDAFAEAGGNFIDTANRYTEGTGERFVGESVAPEITSVRPGHKVAVLGKHDFLKCYAEYVVVDAADITPLPDGVDLDDATAMPVIYLTAHFMLNATAHARKGQTVLIHAAAGREGTAAIQVGKLAGLKLIGLTSSD